MAGRFGRLLAAVVAGSALLAGCHQPADPTTVITVYATSSMIRSLTDIGKKFQQDNPHSSVEYIFAPTSDLANELTAGAGADVFIASEPDEMDRLVAAGVIENPPVPFATNRLVMVTRPGNPQRFADFDDLARPGVRVAQCAEDLTCAGSVRQIEQQSGVRLPPTAKEVSPANVIRDVVRGTADVGLVYFSDALLSDAAIGWVDFPEAARAESVCSAARVKGSTQPSLATRFIAEVTSPANRPVFGQAGFGVTGPRRDR